MRVDEMVNLGSAYWGKLHSDGILVEKLQQLAFCSGSISN